MYLGKSNLAVGSVSSILHCASRVASACCPHLNLKAVSDLEAAASPLQTGGKLAHRVSFSTAPSVQPHLQGRSMLNSAKLFVHI